MYCGQCGTQNNEEAGHCETCGAPLLITAGARTCAACGSSLGDHDRFCPACGASTEDAQVTGAYDATDDFGDLDIDDIEISNLPDWLQELAPQPQEPEISASDEHPTPDDLPDWLREGGPAPDPGATAPPPQQATSSAGLDHQPADQFSLVSDEDLPEWLRSLGDEEPAPATVEQPAQTQETQPSNAVATLFDIPPVTRAWLAHGRQIDPSLVSSAQQEFSPLETVASSVSPSAQPSGIWDTEPLQPNEIEEAGRGEPESGEGGFSGRRLVRIAILVLLIIVVLMLAFVLVQGL